MNRGGKAPVASVVGIQFLSSAGEWMAIILLQILLYRATGSVHVILVLGLCEMVPAILIGPWAGRMVDRIDLRRALTSAGAVRIVLTASLAWPWLWSRPVALLIAATLLAIVTRFFSPAAAALVPRIAAEDRLAAVSSWALAARTAGMATGGGLTALIVDGGWPCILAGLTLPLGCAVILGLRLPLRRLRSPGKAEEWARASSAAALIATYRLAGPIGASMLVSLMLGIFELLAVPYAIGVLHRTEATAALLFATYGAGLFCGLMIATRTDRLPPWRSAVGGALACMIAASWSLGNTARIELALPLILVAGLAEGLILSLCLVRIYRASRGGPVAACVALLDAATAAAFMAGYLLAGALVTALSVGAIMRLSAVVTVAMLLIGIGVVMWTGRHRPRVASPGGAEAG